MFFETIFPCDAGYFWGNPCDASSDACDALDTAWHFCCDLGSAMRSCDAHRAICDARCEIAKVVVPLAFFLPLSETLPSSLSAPQKYPIQLQSVLSGGELADVK